MNRIRNLIPRFGRKAVTASSGGVKLSEEALEVRMYDVFRDDVKAMRAVSYHKHHYLWDVSRLIKSEGIHNSMLKADVAAAGEVTAVWLYVSGIFTNHCICSLF